MLCPPLRGGRDSAASFARRRRSAARCSSSILIWARLYMTTGCMASVPPGVSVPGWSRALRGTLRRHRPASIGRLPYSARPGYLKDSCRGRRPEVDLGEAVNAQGLRQLAAVVGVVGEEAHEHRLPRVDLLRVAPLARERLAQHLRRPALEAAGDDRPRRIERVDQLIGVAWVVLDVLPAGGVGIGEGRRVGPRLA